MSRRSLGAMVSLAFVLAACGGAPGGSVGIGDDDPLLQVSSEGGFAPVEIILNNGPRYTILGDGRIVFQGVQTMQYPGPLVSPYMVAHLDSNQMDAILAVVDDIGLPDMDNETDNSAANTVADATTEVITFWDGEGEHRLAVYALGIVEPPSDRDAAFMELIQTLDQFTAQASAEPYVAERVRIIAGPGLVDPQFEDVREWPLADTDFSDWDELANGWHCTTVDGPVPAVFEGATQATTWMSPLDDSTAPPMQLLVRPLQPGEPACPS